MTRLIADMSMSLDGYIADPDDNISELIGWMFNGGQVEVPTAIDGFTFHTASAGVLRDALGGMGTLLSARRTFDLANGWGGTHPMGIPVFVVSHSVPDGWPDDSSIRFVTDGLDSAVAQAKAAAGDKFVGVGTPSLVRQLIESGQFDEVSINLVPIVLGRGVPFFSGIDAAPVRFGGPTVTESNGVTHLRYDVVNDPAGSGSTGVTYSEMAETEGAR